MITGLREELASRSPEQWAAFLFTNIPLLILFGMSVASLLGLFFYEAEHVFMKFSLIAGVATVGMIGSWNGTVQVYYSIKLQEQIDELKHSNEVLSANNTRLENTVDKLKETSDGLNNQLQQFKGLKNAMEKYASENREDFKEVMLGANKLFTDMEDMTIENERTLLFKAAQDLEFLDRDEGFSEVEFKRFVARLPNKHKDRFEQLTDSHSFANLKSSNNVVEYAKIKELIETLTQQNAAQKSGTTS